MSFQRRISAKEKLDAAREYSETRMPAWQVAQRRMLSEEVMLEIIRTPFAKLKEAVAQEEAALKGMAGLYGG